MIPDFAAALVAVGWFVVILLVGAAVVAVGLTAVAAVAYLRAERRKHIAETEVDG